MKKKKKKIQKIYFSLWFQIMGTAVQQKTHRKAGKTCGDKNLKPMGSFRKCLG